MQPIRFTPDVEQVDPDEQRLTREIVEQMNATARNAFERHRHAHRDAHAKSHAILKGSMTVHDGLSAELAQGIFASPKTYEVVARLSSAPGDIHSDEVPAPRGFAIKVIGVPGDRLSPDIGGENQDFLMVNFPVLAFGTIPKYKQMLGLLEKNAHAPDFFQRLVAGVARGAKDAVEAVGKVPSATLEGLARDNNHPLGETYHTQAAVRFGDHVAKLSLAPKSQSVRDLTGRDLEDVQYSTMRDVIGDFFRANGTEYELRAQLGTGSAEQGTQSRVDPRDGPFSHQRTVGHLVNRRLIVHRRLKQVCKMPDVTIDHFLTVVSGAKAVLKELLAHGVKALRGMLHLEQGLHGIKPRS